jgi:pimeloyl-ACP methyl ester carboxylesterase
VEKIIQDYGAGAGVVLVGHSIGGMLALCVAAAAPVGTITAVEVSGVGGQLKPGLREMWSSKTEDMPSVTIPADAHDQMTLGPSGTYFSAQQTRNAELYRPMPTPELISTLAWEDMLPSVAAKVTMPVSITLAEHDNFWQSDADARAGISLHFTAAPSIRTELFDGAGHSIELHRNARAYCLRQLAFAEQWLST